jgi:hypothetical protein
MQIENGIYRILAAQPDQEENINAEEQLSNDYSSRKFKYTKQLIFN